jgi:hypothetical protein
VNRFTSDTATLAGFVEDADCRAGIAIESLSPGTRVIVRTRNSNYRITVGNEPAFGVSIRGGALFPRVTSARLQGATAGGSFVRIGWIQVGLRMELVVGSHRLITTPVTSLTIDSNKLSAES